MRGNGVRRGRSGPVTLTVDAALGLASLVIEAPGHRPLVAVLSVNELDLVVVVLERLVERAGRNGAIVDVRAALRDALGRDPFDLS